MNFAHLMFAYYVSQKTPKMPLIIGGNGDLKTALLYKCSCTFLPIRNCCHFLRNWWRQTQSISGVPRRRSRDSVAVDRFRSWRAGWRRPRCRRFVWSGARMRVLMMTRASMKVRRNFGILLWWWNCWSWRRSRGIRTDGKFAFGSWSTWERDSGRVVLDDAKCRYYLACMFTDRRFGV